MKYYIIFIWLILCASAVLGQEISLPAGECRIFLSTGGKIENIQLRMIDTLKVEYIKGGNLNDIRVNEINSIESDDQILYFDKHQRLRSRDYDQLILKNEDTVSGVILDISDNNISIRLKSTTKIKKYWPSEVEDYILGTEQDSIKTDNDSIPKSAIDPPTELTPVVAQNREENPSEAIPSDIESKAPGDSVTGEGDLFYLDSYQRGTEDADSVRTGGWGAGGFFLGLTYGSPYLTLGAINSKVEEVEVPQGVDAALYKEGFKNKLIHKRSKSAAAGAAAAKAILTVVALIAIASGF